MLPANIVSETSNVVELSFILFVKVWISFIELNRKETKN